MHEQEGIPPPAPLPKLALSDGLNKSDVNAEQVVEQWLSALQATLDSKDFAGLSNLFIEDSWWRDQVALSWDTRSLRGVGRISKYLSASDHGMSSLQAMKTGALKPVLLDNSGLVWIQAGYSFTTKFGAGQGIVHLTNVDKENTWKAWIILTQLQTLDDEGTPDWDIHDNGIAQSAIKTSSATTNNNGAATNGHTGTTTSSSTTNNGTTHRPSSTPDYQVTIIGAGQSGLTLAAQLKNKGISYIIIDKNVHIGDSWRARYKTITSHTPTYTDHYPFLRFPENYPKWLNQEKIANWQQGYARIMELNIQMGTEVKGVEFDGGKRVYTLSTTTAQQSTGAAESTTSSTLTTRHVVLATGMFGLQPIVPTFPSQSTFKGQIYHAKHHRSATDISDLANKTIVIIGAGTSAHDIAEDFASHQHQQDGSSAGSITMIQRNPIIAISRGSLERHLVGMWDTPKSGLTTAEADLLSHSFPFPVLRTMSVGQTMVMCAEEKEILDKLEAKGMRLKRGETGEGLIDHQYIKGGHFYIDQGAWRHIADGTIKIAAAGERGVRDIDARGVVLADGTVVQADVVVLATGYERCWTTVGEIMGQEVLDKVGRVGELDEEAERVGWWRRTGWPGFWSMTGSFMWARQFSGLLAVQIEAVERGVNEDYWEV